MKRLTSKLGESHSYEEWQQQATEFYEYCDTPMPADWWARWQRVLGINCDTYRKQQHDVRSGRKHISNKLTSYGWE